MSFGELDHRGQAERTRCHTAGSCTTSTDDSAETNNLAEKERARLIAMIGMWYVEAGKYNVLPIDSRGTARFADERPQIAQRRERYVLYPGTQSVPAGAAPKILNRPYAIRAEVEAPEGAEGVLLSMGGNDGGITVYIQGGLLCFAHNYVAKEIFCVKSETTVPAGRHVLGMEFEPTGEPDVKNGRGTSGQVRLYVDGREVGHGEVPVTTPIRLAQGGAMLVGADTGSTVTDDYAARPVQPPDSSGGRRRQRQPRRRRRGPDEDRAREAVTGPVVDLKQLVVVVFQISLFVIVFGYGLRAEFSDLVYLFRRPVLLARSLIVVLLVMPAVAILLARLFDLTITVKIALVALAISPLPPLLPTREAKAGGGARYGLGLMVVLAVLSIAVVPLDVRVITAVFGRTYVTTPGAIAVVTSLSILLPVLFGMATRACALRFADAIATHVERAGKVFMPVAATVLIAAAAPDVWRLVGNGTLVAITVFVVAGFVAGHLLGGPEPEHSAVLAFSAACRHPGTALAVAAANYPDQNLRAAILIYLAVNVVVGLLYAHWHRNQLRRRRDARLEVGCNDGQHSG